MKLFISFLSASLLFISCESNKDNIANQKFQKNAKTVLALIESDQNNKTDYSSFSKDFKSINTSFGDTLEFLNLKEYIENSKKMHEILEIKLVETPVLLPGVDAKTGVADGSVRFYGIWEFKLKKTATYESKTARLKGYESYDFDNEGKIIIQQAYGDLSGLANFLFKK